LLHRACVYRKKSARYSLAAEPILTPPTTQMRLLITNARCSQAYFVLRAVRPSAQWLTVVMSGPRAMGFWPTCHAAYSSYARISSGKSASIPRARHRARSRDFAHISASTSASTPASIIPPSLSYLTIHAPAFCGHPRKFRPRRRCCCRASGTTKTAFAAGRLPRFGDRDMMGYANSKAPYRGN
jgi:hypothetical protein